MRNLKKTISTLSLFSLILVPLKAQEKVIDQVVAVVGKNIILLSEIENQYMQLMAEGIQVNNDAKCYLLEEFLNQKLMINQAAIDSIEVTEGQVELQLNQRMNYFINQIGSQEKLEEYFGKSMLEIKEDMREIVRDQLLTQSMQAEITGDIKITPSEVRDFYKSMPEDSIPFVDAQVEIHQIVKYPPYSEEAIFEVKESLLKLRERIINGEKFSKLAVLYSEGPSAKFGGELGFTTKATLDPAYAKAALSLQEGGISKIVESSFGFHIIQLIERSEDRVNTRHIIMKPKITAEAAMEAKIKLDSLANAIRKDSITFVNAARKFSDDKETRVNGGQVVNMQTGNALFTLDQLNPQEYYIIKNLKVGEISDPFESVDEKGKKVYKIVLLKNKTNPHKADLKQDYTLLKNMAKVKKSQELVEDWINEKIQGTYVHIDGSFIKCDFDNKNWVKYSK